jgi:phospholipid transport system substrate-binding protein
MRNEMKPILFIVVLFLLTALEAPVLSLEEQPLEALQQGIDASMKILTDPGRKDPARKEIELQNLFEITREVFDFKEFSRRVLASHWQEFTPGQRKEFVDVFSEFLGKFYLNKLQEKYNNEKVICLNQEIIGTTRALVYIKVLWQYLEIPVKIRMIKRNGKWKAYDLSVLGISAVMNYRAQFNMVLSKESPQQVIDRLKMKIAELS